MSTEQIIDKYFRPGRLPHIWCPGCGHGIVTGALIKAIDKLGFDKNDVAIISGIGCSSRSTGYLDFNTANTLHGRALPIATGLKMANPKLHVIVIMGDGDATAIGGNHLIHAARRNIDLTVVLYNNSIYGMTGGQYSPMTPYQSKATTAPYGTIERDFNATDLAKAAGATFVGRSTTYHTPMLVDLITQAISHKGFSLVEAISACPTSFGRSNKFATPAAMLEWQKEHGIPKAAWEKLPADKQAETFPIGLLYETKDVPEYTEEYDKLIAHAQGGWKI